MKSDFFWGDYEGAVSEWIGRADKNRTIARIWEKDPTVWTKDPVAGKEIKDRLGWLDAPKKSAGSVAEIKAFAEEVRAAGIQHIVLLGMGGSSLAPWVFSKVYGSIEGYPELIVLDSTHPLQVKDVEEAVKLENTLFVVSSKSGGTIELVSFLKYFYEKVKALKGDEAGSQFIAITDPGSPLEAQAKTLRFRKVFYGMPDVGGRFSVLTAFGLVPAALIGVPIERVIERAEMMAAKCRPEAALSENPAAVLGIAMGVLADSGRDKVTIVLPGKYQAFGEWAEQLVAESTGKEGVGIVPIVEEPIPTEISLYGPDRFFALASFASEAKGISEKKITAIQKAGHPVFTLHLSDEADLGALFFCWEMATAVASTLLRINAFDQPDVQAAKDKTKAILKNLETGGSIEVRKTESTLVEFWENLEENDYVAILAFVPDRDKIRKALYGLRDQIREKTKHAVTVGFGPRYLHSTGQLHKGGANNGVFLLITDASSEEMLVPGERYGFSQLILAQAMGDFEALEGRGRWIWHGRLEEFSEKNLTELCTQISEAIQVNQAQGA